MDKAIVVGGSNGIGLSISNVLMQKNFFVQIIDIVEPDRKNLISEQYTYINCNLLDFDNSLFESLSQDDSVKAVMVTAGFGRIADFDSLHIAEIDNILNVNSIAGIKIARCFYDRLKNDESFYFGMMGSIAGLINSPMFSVYAASKAALCRFIESVNIELEVSESPNRILNVSPGAMKGTNFHGGSNNPEENKELARQIVSHLTKSETLFIPQYNEIFKKVIERYQADPHKFGLESYQYKKDSRRVEKECQLCIGYLSGTFDLFHIGHLNLLKRAKSQCDYLIVGVHESGSWKKKETFIPFEERLEIVNTCKYVDQAVTSCPEDSDAWDLWHYNRLFVGSDYKGTERFNRYEEFFAGKNVQIVYFPYTKSTSSTQLRGIITEITNGTSTL